ncbi:MAG: Mini-ribonuclease 3 [Ruminococcaceae bacterium]|nr:Mini-ribonuclease 3 [Oscillospiraceae bacterium]
MQEKDLPAAMALSYLGDAVYSLYVRGRLVAMGISHSGELNRLSLGFVTAPKQAELAKKLLPLLTEEETGVYRRAFNHKGLSHPAHATYGEYRAATGFEAVLGALHYTGDTARLAYLLDTIHENEFITKEELPT